MISENRKEDTAAEDISITFRLNSEKDRDIIRYLNQVTNKSAEIKRIFRVYMNYIKEIG